MKNNIQEQINYTHGVQLQELPSNNTLQARQKLYPLSSSAERAKYREQGKLQHEKAREIKNYRYLNFMIRNYVRSMPSASKHFNACYKCHLQGYKPDKST